MMPLTLPNIWRRAGRLVPAAAGVAFALATLPAHADVPWGTDVPAGQDHPLVRRFTGAWLVAYQQQTWDQALWPSDMTLAASDQLKNVVTLEGRVTKLVYLAPKGKSPLEVFRNHEQAFSAAGFKREFSCESNCDKFFWGWYKHLKPMAGLTWQNQGSIPAGDGHSRFSMTSAVNGNDNARFWVGSAQRGGQPVHVLLYTGDAGSGKTGIATAFLQIVEPKAMPTGQVVVADAATLRSGLASEGKAVLGGLLFDTGKATLQAESKPQLEAMAALLQAQPEWKVFIVGHTDNVGNLDANQALSQQRAQAVVAALTAPPYAIDAKRLLARGVANVAPVAANTDDAGRARNRRVEMVLQ